MINWDNWINYNKFLLVAVHFSMWIFIRYFKKKKKKMRTEEKKKPPIHTVDSNYLNWIWNTWDELKRIVFRFWWNIIMVRAGALPLTTRLETKYLIFFFRFDFLFLKLGRYLWELEWHSNVCGVWTYRYNAFHYYLHFSLFSVSIHLPHYLLQWCHTLPMSKHWNRDKNIFSNTFSLIVQCERFG